MIDLVNISIQYSGKYLFDNVNVRINPHEKIALVGSNGTGKSTLLKMLSGKEEPESGKILKQKGISIGYLPQEFVHFSTQQLFDEVKTAFKTAEELETLEQELQQKLETAGEPEREELILRIGEIHHKKEDIDFYNIDSRVAKVLNGLGFEESDFSKQTDQFSGGWQMRIELAKILLADHDLILLDEPTNHLDIDSLQWVMGYLMQFKGSLIIVSHDRYFVNHITTKTLEIFNRKINFFNGNYDAYLTFKEERDEQLRSQLKNREREVKQITDFIERFRYKSTKARQVQSRIKMLERMEAIDTPESESTIELAFPEPPRSGAVPVELHNISKSFGDHLVFEGVDLQLEREDKVAFVGPNGAGKTTLAKIIADKLAPSSGHKKLGHNTYISYYAQSVTEELNPENEIIDEVAEVGADLTPGQLRSLLGSFLFSDDDVFKKTRVLSGGEKSRVALAKILLQQANLIILDEPTNHLDFNSKKMLQKALMKYTGALVIVSHDIDFIRPIVNRVVEIRHNHIKSYPGGIDYYLLKQEELEKSSGSQYSSGQKVEKVNRKDEKRRIAELRQEKSKATKGLRESLEKIEKEIETLENNIKQLEADLADPDVYSIPDKARDTKLNYDNSKTRLESVYEQWTEINEQLESIEQEFESQLSKNS